MNLYCSEYDAMTTEHRKTVEHDVDMLVVEEIYVSPEFRRRLVKHATGVDAVDIRVIEARRSVSESPWRV